MSKGSWIHDDVSRHFGSCTPCRETDVENKRRKHDKPGQVSERDVPAEVFAAMCPDGRSIYRSYLRWLAEPDESLHRFAAVDEIASMSRVQLIGVMVHDFAAMEARSETDLYRRSLIMQEIRRACWGRMLDLGIVTLADVGGR